MPNIDKCVLFLIPSKDDPDIFSREYQKELGSFSKSANATSQRAFVMDAVGGGGGPLGEFIFNNAGTLITALTTLAGTWIGSRYGRKLKLKIGDTEIEANTVAELEKMVELIKKIESSSKVLITNQKYDELLQLMLRDKLEDDSVCIKSRDENSAYEFTVSYNGNRDANKVLSECQTEMMRLYRTK